MDKNHIWIIVDRAGIGILLKCRKVGLFHLATQIKIKADNGKVTIDLANDIQASKNKEKIKELTQKMEGVKEVIFTGKEYIRDNPFAEWSAFIHRYDLSL